MHSILRGIADDCHSSTNVQPKAKEKARAAAASAAHVAEMAGRQTIDYRALLSKRLECCFPEKILACHFTAVADRASNFVATFARTWAIQRKPTLWRAWLRSVAGEARAKINPACGEFR